MLTHTHTHTGAHRHTQAHTGTVIYTHLSILPQWQICERERPVGSDGCTVTAHH